MRAYFATSRPAYHVLDANILRAGDPGKKPTLAVGRLDRDRVVVVDDGAIVDEDVLASRVDPVRVQVLGLKCQRAEEV